MAENFLVRSAQGIKLSEEIINPEKRFSKQGKSGPSSLNIFLDDYNFVRVGGRLSHFNLPFNPKFRIILTDTKLKYIHLKYFYLGSQTLLFHVRLKF